MEFVNDILNQVGNLGTGAMLVLAVIVTGYIARGITSLPNALIPLITFVVAVGGNYLMGDVGQVSPATRNPQVRLAFVGIAYWGIGWLLHNQGLSRLEKFLPAPLRGLIGVEPEAAPAPTKKSDILPLP